MAEQQIPIEHVTTISIPLPSSILRDALSSLPLRRDRDTAGVDARGARSVDVHVYEWQAAEPRAIVYLLHGAGEHARRYDPLARELNAAGYTVIADDHLGHGATATAAGGAGLSNLGVGGNEAAFAAVREVSRRIAAERPGVPLVLAGHSWGSLLAQQLFAREQGRFAGLVLTGTALSLPGYIDNGDLNRAFHDDETGRMWLSRSKAQRDAFGADPLCFDIGEQPVWSFRESLALVSVPPRDLLDLPVLIMGGSEDSLSYRGRGARALARAYRRRSKLSDVTLRLFEGARHEVFFEENRDEVVAALIEWLRARY